MSQYAHLWAVGFDEPGRAALVRDEIIALAWERHCLVLLDVAVAVCYPDGTLTLNGEPLPALTKKHGGILSRLLADLALSSPPLTSGAVGAACTNVGGASAEAGISDEFVREMVRLIKPGTSVLFVLDEAKNIDAILQTIRGLGGTVLKTNVDLERAKLIQSTLTAPAGGNAQL